MLTITTYPEKKQDAKALRAFLQAMNIRFEDSESPYNPEFVAKIQASDADKAAGRVRKITLDEIWSEPKK